MLSHRVNHHGRVLWTTDRVVAEWWLGSERVKSILADNPMPAKAPVARITLPSNLAEVKAGDSAAAARIQAEVREQFQKWFSKGYAATNIESSGATMDYTLEPATAVAGLQLQPPGAE